jgi:hypothetical protein
MQIREKLGNYTIMFATLVGLRIDDDGLIRTLHSFHLIQIGLICILPPVGLVVLATHKHCASTPPVGLVVLATHKHCASTPPVGLVVLATHKHCASTPPVGLAGLAGLATFAIGAFATV